MVLEPADEILVFIALPSNEESPDFCCSFPHITDLSLDFSPLKILAWVCKGGVSGNFNIMAKFLTW